MGIKGLQGFVQNSCSNVCSMVNLRTMATRHKSSYPDCVPTIVVDAMCCLRTWYTPEAWIHGGQWKEYLTSLQDFIDAFKNAGIRLVFVFDGVVEQKKRAEWVKRRMRDSSEVSKIFNFLKSSRQQPGRNKFFIPSGIATFTRFAVKALGQEIICSQVEGDYETASYALKHNCLGILGEDSDYLIFDTVPYFSINKLRLDQLVTLMYSRESFCGELGLRLADLPLLACLLGNDIVPENMMEPLHRKCVGAYHSYSNERNRRANVIRAVASFISKIQLLPHGFKEVEKMLPPNFDLTLLEKGIQSYILPQQSSSWLSHSPKSCADKSRASVCQDQEIVQIALEEHYKGDNVMICNVLCLGESDCSNTLEDENDPHIPSQALVYKIARQHIYAILLGTGNDSPDSCPVVHEWYVYNGNTLEKAELVPSVPLSIPGGTPTARELWLSKNPDIQKQRFYTCMACFHAERWTEGLTSLDSQLAATCCLLIYLSVQVENLSLTDVEAFLAQALCLAGKSGSQLSSLQLPYVDSRAVHLAFLFLRGLNTLMACNSACGYPFNMMDLMPWNTFDGKLFHQKYLLCHEHRPMDEILEKNESLITEFKKLRLMITEACATQNRILQPASKKNSGPLPGASRGSFTRRDQSYSQYRQGSERNEWHNVHHQQEPGRGWPFNPYHDQRHETTYWQNPQSHHQGQYPSHEDGSRGNIHHAGHEYGRYNPGQRTRHRGQSRRGHYFSNS
ncbi:constitutive coactivator of peroxisome proliferator-activated receptor gamma isoform X2 [Hyla sarda]|uniref:constitutive coactivator of peroxisome proliferator-activated receptor gamma isoform X2 n=1 Tax=Hyla sarda TaxID=327740 RepID=UPI0024C410AF|nr:constitutive coactivator of peroxisome proliferator-activated receptor gamma isoform X2 [Hyla sarda]